MRLESPVFKNNGMVPSKFTCEGQDINPPLRIEDLPEGTKSLALVVDDPDAPQKDWVHWVVYDIPPDNTYIEEDQIPGKEGQNDFRRKHYGGPCPPFGKHHYHFKVYALDRKLDLKGEVSKQQLEEAMDGHILEKSELIGTYGK